MTINYAQWQNGVELLEQRHPHVGIMKCLSDVNGDNTGGVEGRVDMGAKSSLPGLVFCVHQGMIISNYPPRMHHSPSKCEQCLYGGSLCDNGSIYGNFVLRLIHCNTTIVSQRIINVKTKWSIDLRPPSLILLSICDCNHMEWNLQVRAHN